MGVAGMMSRIMPEAAKILEMERVSQVVFWEFHLETTRSLVGDWKKRYWWRVPEAEV